MEEKKFVCPHKNCGQKFINSNRLKRHSLLHVVKKQSICNVCGKKFSRSDYLTRHMIAHSNEKPFECNINNCGKLFKRKTSLNDHQKEVHRILNLEYKCHICGKSFPSTKNLIPHIGSHTKKIKKPYQCSICNRSFTRPGQLKSHMMIHYNRQDRQESSPEKLNCETSAASLLQIQQSICVTKGEIEKNSKKRKLETTQNKFNVLEMDSANQNNLLQHPIIMNENSYKCVVCNLIFDQKYKLEKHGRLHAVEHLCNGMVYFYRNAMCYKCIYCPISIRTKLSFMQHLVKHLKDQFVECYLCNRIFISENDLTIHLVDHFDKDDKEVIDNSDHPVKINKTPESKMFNIVKREEKINTKKLRKKRVYVSLEKNEIIDKMAIKLLQNKIKNAVLATNVRNSETASSKNEIENNGTFVECLGMTNNSESKTINIETCNTDCNKNEIQIYEDCNINKTINNPFSQTEYQIPINRDTLLSKITQKDSKETQNVKNKIDTTIENNDGNIKNCVVEKNIERSEISLSQDKDQMNCENYSEIDNLFGDHNVQQNEVDVVNDRLLDYAKDTQTNSKNNYENTVDDNQTPNFVECNVEINNQEIPDDFFDENYVEVFVIQTNNDKNSKTPELVNCESNLRCDEIIRNRKDKEININKERLEESKNNYNKNSEKKNSKNSKEYESMLVNINENNVSSEIVTKEQIKTKNSVSNNSTTISKEIIKTAANSSSTKSLETQIHPTECIVLDDDEDENKNENDLVNNVNNKNNLVNNVNNKNNLCMNINADKSLPRIENQAQFFAGKLKHLINDNNPTEVCKNITKKENVNNKCHVIRFNPNRKIYPITDAANQQTNAESININQTKPAIEIGMTKPTRDDDIPVVELSDDDIDSNNDKSIDNNKSRNNKSNETTIISLRSPLPFVTQHKKRTRTTKEERQEKKNILKILTKNLSKLVDKLQELNIPISFKDIIFYERHEYVQEISNYDFSDEQLKVIRKIRKRSRPFVSKLKSNTEESKLTKEQRYFPIKDPVQSTSLQQTLFQSPLPSTSAENITKEPSPNITPALLQSRTVTQCPVTISFQHPQNSCKIIQQLPLLYNSAVVNSLGNNIDLTAELSNNLTTYGHLLSTQNIVSYPHNNLTQNPYISNFNFENITTFNRMQNVTNKFNGNNDNGTLTILMQPSQNATINGIP